MAACAEFIPSTVSPGCSSAVVTAKLAPDPELRLDVSIVSAEQFFRAVDCQLFNHVDVFTAAVVTLARIPFSIFVGQLRALRLHNARTGVVFGRRSVRCALPDVLFPAP